MIDSILDEVENVDLKLQKAEIQYNMRTLD